MDAPSVSATGQNSLIDFSFKPDSGAISGPAGFYPTMV